MRHFWLLFSQVVTVVSALWFIVTTFKPTWLPHHRPTTVTLIQEPAGKDTLTTPRFATSFRDAAAAAMPSVVNIITTKNKESEKPSKNLYLQKFPAEYNREHLKEQGEEDTNHPDNDKHSEQQEKRQDDADESLDDAMDISHLGSGVIISPEGYILTNHHVIEAAVAIDVTLSDGRTTKATVVGTDPDTDLAVIKIDLPRLPAITFSQIEQARVGDIVLAIGNPFGVGQSVTIGIISALNRQDLDLNTFENFIQTDAAINPGNSGGALVDTQGHLLGINTAIYSRHEDALGIGFAIPTTIATYVMNQIIRTGHVVRGYMGIESQNMTPEVAESFGLSQQQGVITVSVVKGGPADMAGLKPGDIILSMNAQPISNATDLMHKISQMLPGNAATLQVARKSRKIKMMVVVSHRPPFVFSSEAHKVSE